MNFTREPIIETIISPKDGFKLLVRSSKGGNSEEYYVDAIEVVSFGRAFFFRSLERPKPFLVPASDYEIVEVKETRVALKNVSHERNIKIGGGREAPVRQREKEQPIKEEETTPLLLEDAPAEKEAEGGETPAESRIDRRRDRRRHRRRRPVEEQEWTERTKGYDQQQRETDIPKPEAISEGGGAQDETKVSSSMFSSLFPPPPTLISETLSRYKDKELAEGFSEAPSFQEEKKDDGRPTREKKGEDPGIEPSSLNRAYAPEESGSFTTSHFSSLSGMKEFNHFF